MRVDTRLSEMDGRPVLLTECAKEGIRVFEVGLRHLCQDVDATVAHGEAVQHIRLNLGNDLVPSRAKLELAAQAVGDVNNPNQTREPSGSVRLVVKENAVFVVVAELPRGCKLATDLFVIHTQDVAFRLADANPGLTDSFEYGAIVVRKVSVQHYLSEVVEHPPEKGGLDFRLQLFCNRTGDECRAHGVTPELF